MVSWLVNHSRLECSIYEIQISRTENHIIIYNRNISVFSVDSDEYMWTWTSELPLECVDHSVRIRCFYNQSVLSPWSNWITNNGTQATEKIQIFPFQRVLREGTSAMFCCVPPRGVNITRITFSNYEYPLIRISDSVKSISVDNLTIPTTFIKAHSLSCSDTTGKLSRSSWNYVSFPTQKPGNLSCVTSDMTSVTCTWDSGRKRHPHDRNKQTNTLHIENSDQAPINCKQSSCTFPAVPHLEEYNISVVVKDQLGEETESYSFNISDRVFPVVEWDRVSPGVTDATVSWIIHRNLTQLNLLCQVTTDPGSTTELSCSSTNGTCQVKVEHLLPNTCYSTRVRCSVNGRLWGAWTRPVSFPTHPLVTLDVWRRIKQLSDPNSRQVTLLWTPVRFKLVCFPPNVLLWQKYWCDSKQTLSDLIRAINVPLHELCPSFHDLLFSQHVSGSATTVNIQGYVVQWLQEGQNCTKRKDSGQTQTEVLIGSGQYDFTVSAVLQRGSTIPTHITIPQRDDGENLPVLKRVSSGTAASFKLCWDEQDTATCGYTVEWCILGNAEPCTLRWMKVPEGNNTLSLPAENFKAGCRYTFNIYGCTKSGHRLLEIQTGYSQELESVPSPSLVEPVQSTSSSVTLEWRYNEDDVAHPAFITGYLVTVQEVASHTLSGHAANLFNVSVADPQRKSVTMRGLQPNQEYVFSVRALTKEGPGQPASITIRTKADYLAHLTKILTPILLLLCCTALLWPQRKMLRRGLKGIFAYPAGMNIKTPELDSFLHETCERQTLEIEECSICDIEIVDSRPPLNEETTQSDAEPLNTLPSPGSQPSPTALSLSNVLFQAEYCPQSVTALCGQPALQQTTCIINKSYFQTKEEYLSEAQQVPLSEISKPSGTAGTT
uniref:leukemia inhibitory factor receptor n=1 Tax=Scatophagus argus TaxID=75038 RepID=UPI001ED85548|nr:leukemia inhibitory factor receptor [Scatophagus argus]